MLENLSLNSAFLFVITCSVAAQSSPTCKSWLVQSIPTEMPYLSDVPGVFSTADVFRWLAGNSTDRLDIIAQYWQLRAQPHDPHSGDYGFSEADMRRFGSHKGQQVYHSLENAAARNISIRILQHSGVYPNYDRESADLASGKANVKNVTLKMSEWWGSGIVHAKIWISDCKDIYIGSSNNDWKSLTQVKEVGIYLVNCPTVAKEVETYFTNLWELAHLNSSAYTRKIWDKQWQVYRKVPCWSHFIPYRWRCRSPLSSYVDVPHIVGYPMISDPDMFNLSFETPGYNKSTSKSHSSYLSFAPPELSFAKFQTDEQGWLDTIKSVKNKGTVRISTMDWLGQSQYIRPTIYWSTLSSAISQVIFSKGATVKLLVSYWAHFIQNTDHYVKFMLTSNVLCSSSKYNKCTGKIEIKYYMVPGFNMSGPALTKNGTRTGNIYPGYTRVNHGKYAVSDVRAHIGTSNLVWDYFYTTAGMSFGTYSPAIVAQLQEIFDADWNSPYTYAIEQGDLKQPL